VLEDAPRAQKRTFTIREFAAIVSSDELQQRRITGPNELVSHAASWRGSATITDYDVPDPIGRAQQFHREVADVLDASCGAVAHAVVGAVLSDVSPR
jgi:hypothetical protein